MESTKITVSTLVNDSLENTWKYFNAPEHIVQWNAASDDWHTTFSTVDLQVGGKFNSRMEAKDGSFGFDFEGIYEVVDLNSRIVYGLEDGRKVEIVFDAKENGTLVTETFDAETENPVELQRGGWQAIMDNFKKHVESL
ncbi:polyketide cyclase [Lacihabitans sp. LS3-19]|uniref:SRPBCC family protein n=1 Tax=Lacihabitans sp. LS3-19 TaxID=2487335 RepID=UPI0020CEA898|nr:SRPBCC family protein [Lacihabitans sp. LS3-19]MCP9770285.1 polyketide cyclase [Lacihabitans sp. LS3-19]